MSSDSGGHDSHKQDVGQVVKDNSMQDVALCVLANLVLLGLINLGYHWFALPLPVVHAEKVSIEKQK